MYYKLNILFIIFLYNYLVLVSKANKSLIDIKIRLLIKLNKLNLVKFIKSKVFNFYKFR